MTLLEKQVRDHVIDILVGWESESLTTMSSRDLREWADQVLRDGLESYTCKDDETIMRALVEQSNYQWDFHIASTSPPPGALWTVAEGPFPFGTHFDDTMRYLAIDDLPAFATWLTNKCIELKLLGAI